MEPVQIVDPCARIRKRKQKPGRINWTFLEQSSVLASVATGKSKIEKAKVINTQIRNFGPKRKDVGTQTTKRKMVDAGTQTEERELDSRPVRVAVVHIYNYYYNYNNPYEEYEDEDGYYEEPWRRYG